VVRIKATAAAKRRHLDSPARECRESNVEETESASADGTSKRIVDTGRHLALNPFEALLDLRAPQPAGAPSTFSADSSSSCHIRIAASRHRYSTRLAFLSLR